MKVELQKKLFEKYPELFQQKDQPMTQTCMCWGIECGDGWYQLIDDSCHKWEILKKYFSGCRVELTQIKEKYGYLCLYHQISWEDDVWANIADFERNFIVDLSWHIEQDAVSSSMEICEECGAPGKINQGPWYRTRCRLHVDCK